MFSSLLLLLGALFLVPSATPVHGQFTGTVCIIPTSASSCPSTPVTISGTIGTQLRVSIFIQGSDAINGFQVILLANRTILKPAGADLTGTVLPGPQTVLAECLGGVLVKGSACRSVDTPDTLELSAVACNGCSTSNPVTGLLFTAIYNVTATTTGTPIGYQTGCSDSSVSGTTTCVVTANLGAVPETVQTAVFSTGSNPDFTLTTNFSSLTIQQGNNCATSPISVTSVNNFNGTVSLTSAVSPSGGPASTMSPASVSLAPGQSMISQLTVCATPSTPTGSYTVTVTGMSGSLSHTLNVSVTVTSPPPPPDFVISASPTSLTIAQGSCETSMIDVSSRNGFTGTVALSSTITPPGPTSTLPSSVSLPNGGTAGVTLTVCTTSSTPAGSYSDVVTGTSGSLSHSTTVSVTVTPPPDFTITISPASQTLHTGSTANFVVSITGLNGFNSNVTLSATVSPITKHTPTTQFSPSTIVPGQTSTLTVFATHNTSLGTYTITVTGTSGSLTHSVTVTVTVTH